MSGSEDISTNVQHVPIAGAAEAMPGAPPANVATTPSVQSSSVSSTEYPLPVLPRDLPWPQPLIELPNITIRPLHPSDVEPLAHAANDHLIAMQMTDRFPHPYTASDATRFIAMCLSHSPTHEFALSLTPTGPAVGTIGLKPDDQSIFAHTVEVGYWIARAHWGRGLISAALDAFVDYCFRDASEGGAAWERLGVGAFGGNDASCAVARKVGFRREGVLKGAVKKKGVVRDLVLFGLLRDEWRGGEGAGG